MDANRPQSEFEIWQLWQRRMETTGMTVQTSRGWLIETILWQKYQLPPNLAHPNSKRRAEELADRMIATAGQINGNQQVNQNSSNSNQQTTKTITNKTTTTVTVEMRYLAANDFIQQVTSAGGSGMTQEQIQQAAEQIRNGQKDDWVKRNRARPKAPAIQPMALPTPPAPPAPPQPVYNPPPPPAQVVPPAAPAQVVYVQPATAPVQLPTQQATAGSSNYQSSATTITTMQTSSSSMQQGQQNQMHIPGFLQPVYTMPPQSPPGQQYVQPAQQPQQITSGPAQTHYPQYNNQQHAQQQSQIAYAGTPQQASNQLQGYQQPGSPAPQYAGYTTGPTAGQYVATSPPAAPDKPKKKKKPKKAER